MLFSSPSSVFHAKFTTSVLKSKYVFHPNSVWTRTASFGVLNWVSKSYAPMILNTNFRNILTKNPYFFPTPKLWNPYFFRFFISKKKNCSHHHRHHFHLRFYRVLSIGWGRWFFVKKLEKEELNIKHFWCGMGWRVFESNFIARGEDSCFLKYFN